MSRDVVITPANGIIEFSNASVTRAQIQFDNTSNNLIITSSNGDVVIGDVGRNVYIGDGTNSVDVIFEQNGAIRALDGKTITLGQANSFVNIAANIVGSVNITGNLIANNLVVQGSINSGLIVEGSINSGATNYAGYRSVGTNIILKGDSAGRSAIFFQSEKDGTNINHPSDFGYIQFHSYGIDGSTGESNRFVIGVANDSDDFLVLQSPYKNGVKISFLDATSGTGGTQYTVWHAGNHGAGSTLDADLLDGQQGSYYAPNSSLANYVSRTGSSNVTTFKINSTDGNFDIFQNVTAWTNSTNHPLIRWSYNQPYDDNLYFASGGNAAANTQTAMVLSEFRGVLFGLGATDPSSNTFPLTNEWMSINDNIVRLNSTLQITNTTLVANLNADLLDGQEGSFYSNATNINAGTLNASRLPTVGTAGTYGNTTHVPVITTDAYGRVSSVTNTAISFPAETDTLQSVTGRGNTSDRIITLSNTTKTTSNTTGSLLVAGGIAVTGNVALQQIFFADGTSMNTAAFGSGGGGGTVGSSTGSNIYLAYNFGGF